MILPARGHCAAAAAGRAPRRGAHALAYHAGRPGEPIVGRVDGRRRRGGGPGHWKPKEVPADKGEHLKAAVGVAPDVPKPPDHFWGHACPPHRPGARRVDRGPAVVAHHVVHYDVPARNDDLFNVGHLLLDERVTLGQAGTVADAVLDGAAAVLVRAVCVQLARRAEVPPAPALRPPLCLPRIARRDRLSPAVLGSPRAALRRGVRAVVVPVACGEPLVVAVQGGPVGSSILILSSRPALSLSAACLASSILILSPRYAPSLPLPPPWPPATRACGPSRPAPRPFRPCRRAGAGSRRRPPRVLRA